MREGLLISCCDFDPGQTLKLSIQEHYLLGENR